jgi:thiamine-phosphate pyrophosphorylase
MSRGKPFSDNSERQIYCFADTIDICLKLLKAGAKIIQFRAKERDDASIRRIAKEMLTAVRSYENAILIINDRVDIAIDIQADGVHVGKEDEDFHSVIKRTPERMIVGVTAKTPSLAKEAEAAGAAYIGTGAVFPSPTKPGSSVIGIDGLRKVVQAAAIPVVAIGGITPDNIKEVMKTGAQYYAVISEINSAEDISAQFNRFMNLIKNN